MKLLTRRQRLRPCAGSVVESVHRSRRSAETGQIREIRFWEVAGRQFESRSGRLARGGRRPERQPSRSGDWRRAHRPPYRRRCSPPCLRSAPCRRGRASPTSPRGRRPGRKAWRGSASNERLSCVRTDRSPTHTLPTGRRGIRAAAARPTVFSSSTKLARAVGTGQKITSRITNSAAASRSNRSVPAPLAWASGGRRRRNPMQCEH